MWEGDWIETGHVDGDEVRNQEIMTIYAAEEGGVRNNVEEVSPTARIEEPPDLLASLLHELGGVGEFGPVEDQEGALVQDDSLYTLTSSSNCDLFLNMVSEDPEVTLSSLQLSSGSTELSFQPSSGSPLPSTETLCSTNGGHKSSVNDQRVESVVERPHISQAPTESVRQPATSAPKCQCSMHMLVGYPPSQVVQWTVVLAQGTPIFASPGICLLFLRGYLKCIQAFINSNSQEEEIDVSLCHSCVAWSDKQVEANLGVVEEARERGLLQVGDVELEEDDAEERPLDGMCRELILEAFSCRLEERLAKIEVCREIIIEEMNKCVTTHVEGIGSTLREVAKRPEIGRLERGRSARTPNVGMKQKWKGQPEPSEEPSRKRGRRSMKETMRSSEVSEERHSARRRSLRKRTSLHGGYGNSLVEEPPCKKAMPSDDVSCMMMKDINHNTNLGGNSVKLMSQVEASKSLFYIQCPACAQSIVDTIQFEKHVDSEHRAGVGRLRTATKCCCSLHSHVCRAFADSKETKHRLARGVGGMSRPDTPEEKRARAALSRHQLLLNMNHDMLCSLCIRFANFHLHQVDNREEDKVVAEKKEPGIGESSQECHKEGEKRRDCEFSWEFGRALEVQVEKLTDKQLEGWRVLKKEAMMPSSLKSNLVDEVGGIVMVGDTRTIDEQSKGDLSEDGACEGGQRLKQLLLMEASLKRLLDQGDLVEEERESLTRMNRLIHEQWTPS